MSWAQAKAIAETLYASLRATHTHAFLGMIISALDRLHKAEGRNTDDTRHT